MSDSTAPHPDDHRYHGAPRRAERQTHAYVVPILLHGVRHDRVVPDGDEQGKRAERPEEHRADAWRRPRATRAADNGSTFSRRMSRSAR